MKIIDSFDKEFSFLSNFFPCEVEFEGMTFGSTEHAFVAAKTLDRTLREQVQAIREPGKVKRFGRRLKLREDWEQVKLDVMLELLRKKFSIPELREALLATGDAELIEGNYWRDFFWGVCQGVGTNHLGRLLMQVRRECNEVNT